MSISSVWVRSVLQETFPDLYAGHYNCRRISGSSTWSQHAWPNALDLTNVKYGYSTDPANQTYLDTVADFLVGNVDALSIARILWRGRSILVNRPVSGHHNHIHIDFWPQGHATPTCGGGRLRYRYPDGRIVVGDPGPMNGISEVLDPRPEPDTDEVYQMRSVGKGSGYKSESKQHHAPTVKAAQQMLAHHGHADERSIDNVCAADGYFGDGTDAAARAFQRASGLVVDGVIGRLTWAALEGKT